MITLKSGKTIELNQAFNCDCLDFMPQLPDKCIDMILCDLPYGTTACKWDTIIPFEPLWEQYKRIIKDGGAIVLTASQPFTSALIMSNIKDYKYNYVWNKKLAGNGILAGKQPLKIHEDVCVFGIGKIKYNEKITKGKLRKKNGIKDNHGTFSGAESKIVENDIYHGKSIIEFSVAGERLTRIHPTQKPVKLFQYLIETYTDKNDLVFDNCLGSFTTGVSAYNTGRNWLGCEMDEQIFEDGSLRYEQETKQLLMEF